MKKKMSIRGREYFSPSADRIAYEQEREKNIFCVVSRGLWLFLLLLREMVLKFHIYGVKVHDEKVVLRCGRNRDFLLSQFIDPIYFFLCRRDQSGSAGQLWPEGRDSPKATAAAVMAAAAAAAG